MALERELKLEFEPAAARKVAQWLHHIGAQRKSSQSMRSIYFDIDDLALCHNGVTLRIREIGDRHTQTIKQSGPQRAAGLFDRPEWETPVDGFAPDLAAARATGLKVLRRRKVAQSLQPVFEVETLRSRFDLPGEDGVALTVDRGQVVADGKRRRFTEIELESLNGEAEGLFRIARAIAEIAPVGPGVHSKSDRGYALLQNNETRIYRAGDVALAPDTPAADAFRMIAQDCLRQLTANVPATLSGTSEALHQMRVALRRLRACMSLFSDMIEGRETEQIKAGVRWITRCLGDARDLDVMIDDLLHRRSNGAVPPSMTRRLEQQRRHAYAAVREALRSPRFRRLLVDALAWIECGSWRRKRGDLAKTCREQPVGAHAAAELERRNRKLAKAAPRLDKLSPEERHELRIRAKRLRYAVEFFSSLYSGKKEEHRRDRLLSALKELQSTLGELNDIANREKLISELATPANGNADGSTAVALYRPAADADRLLDSANKAARQIAQAKPFWD